MKPILISITRNEVTFAVDFETAKIAQSTFAAVKTDDSATDNINPQDTVTGPETKDWLDRQILDAYQTLKLQSRPYIDHDRCRIVRDTVDHSANEWNLSLIMPDTWRSEPDELAAAATRYVIKYALAKWYDMVNPQRADSYEQQAASALHQYRDILNNSLVTTQYY